MEKILPEAVIRDFIRSVLSEAKIKEAEITCGEKVKHGGRKHKQDLKRRIKEIEWARDKYKRGTEKRANYTRILSQLKRELRSLEPRNY